MDDVREALGRVLDTVNAAAPSGFVARAAREEDCGHILRLTTELAEFEGDADAVVLTEEALRRQGFSSLACPAFHCVLVECTGATEEEGAASYAHIAGYALFYVAFSTWCGRYIHLEDLFVKEAFRKRSLGHFLISILARLAGDLDMPRLHWTAMDWNAPALAFYEKIGAQQLGELILHRLDGPVLEAYNTQIDRVESTGRAEGEAKGGT